jgi:hypothetical protein
MCSARDMITLSLDRRGKERRVDIDELCHVVSVSRRAPRRSSSAAGSQQQPQVIRVHSRIVRVEYREMLLVCPLNFSVAYILTSLLELRAQHPVVAILETELANIS